MVQSQTIQIGGSISNAPTNSPIPGKPVYFFAGPSIDTLVAQTDSMGTFFIEIPYQPSITYVDVSTTDFCTSNILRQTVNVNYYDSLIYVHFDVCADTASPSACNASFGYVCATQNDSIYSDSMLTRSPNLVYFYDQSQGNPTQWNWNFGDGQTSTDRNPLHIYADSGSYLVTLAISSPYCSNQFASYVYVGTYHNDTTPEILCNASFGYVCATQNDSIYSDSMLTRSPNLVYFYDLSQGNPTQWNWNFGDGQTSTHKNPLHIYADSGSYLVTLAISSPYCSNQFASYVYVGTYHNDTTPEILCNASFGYTCTTQNDSIYSDSMLTSSPNLVYFYDQSQGNPTQWNWNFGDGQTSTDKNPLHIYARFWRIPGHSCHLQPLLLKPVCFVCICRYLSQRHHSRNSL